MKLINNHDKPIILDDGTTLAASGTDGSIKDVESITDRDRRRYVETGRVAVEEKAVKQSRTKEAKE